MKEKILLFIFASICMHKPILGQIEKDLPINSNRFCVRVKQITEVSICDTSVINKILTFIANQKNNDSSFQKFGYLRLEFTKLVNPSVNRLENCYTLLRSYYYFYKVDDDKKFPLYYTKIGDKLVLIYVNQLSQIGLNSRKKSKFVKMVNKTLVPIKYTKLKNEKGEVIKLSPMGNIVLDKGEIICR